MRARRRAHPAHDAAARDRRARSCARAASFSTSATRRAGSLGAVDIHDIKESFPERELSNLVIAADLVTEIPFVTPEEPLTSRQREALVPRHRAASRRRVGGRPQVPRRRHAARPARRVRQRGPAAQPPASRACARSGRGGRGRLPRAAGEAPADRGGRPRVDRGAHHRGGGPAVAATASRCSP